MADADEPARDAQRVGHFAGRALTAVASGCPPSLRQDLDVPAGDVARESRPQGLGHRLLRGESSREEFGLLLLAGARSSARPW